MSIIDFARKNKRLFKPILVAKYFVINILTYIRCSKELKSANFDISGLNIFYFGKPVHSNLGDLAQGVCIRKWLKKHYPNYSVIEIETNSVVNTRFPIIKQLKKIIKDTDLFVFQSGYTTTDLGGFADLMHRKIVSLFPNNRKIMMPQTIFFQDKRNEKRTSEILNSDQNLLFLARDSVSYKKALEMFPDIRVMLFPDIVTTLIGKRTYNNEREGIIFCLRDDSEKYYSDIELESLIGKCSILSKKIERLDTTKKLSKDLLKETEKYINDEITNYSKYKVMVTDRYHGTILALAAGTPVIILKTTDHKVVTGADWFKGILDDYVYVASDLEEAYDLISKVYYENKKIKQFDYFESEYYDKLPMYIENE
ncbi:Exopolysaccharide biosynthesis protein EpsI, predicted pyruvyl transferase [Ruminococcus sp. YE71]|uniref:polysaccharide pyruvyl transferase family protein n=1 Tax=unclassified Ruminococcus TaxID=2608920 RepID=UPI00088A4EBF|nr:MULTISPECIES: polysaccharide pyruvyl transferase family protein [unclassified Ruminococcus]SDA11360.1 Exopolysaccharide biosynthesis protein EpsI, predicted pyruvyl transferase [Ruminococcus sp. YE78]SFW15142.1 Exopolysaccharide biosynthesis protein EpsI, predicted pyruvyl transferase [Ruminococcus sp. YE71]